MVPGELVGPFTVGGNIDSATLDAPESQVFRDADGLDPVADGDPVEPGDALWIRYDPTVPDQVLVLIAEGVLPVGTVYLPTDATAPALMLAAEATIPLQAEVAVLPQASGSLRVDVMLDGAAAGQQAHIALAVRCEAGTWEAEQRVTIPAGATSSEGPIVAATLSDLPPTAECSVTQTDTGGTAEAVFDAGASSALPASVTIASDEMSSITVSNVYGEATADTPAGSPDSVSTNAGPSVSADPSTVLPATGGPAGGLGVRALLAVLIGIALLAAGSRGVLQTRSARAPG